MVLIQDECIKFRLDEYRKEFGDEVVEIVKGIVETKLVPEGEEINEAQYDAIWFDLRHNLKLNSDPLIWENISELAEVIPSDKMPRFFSIILPKLLGFKPH